MTALVTAVSDSPLGPLRLFGAAAEPVAVLAGLYYDDHHRGPRDVPAKLGSPADFGDVEAQLAAYFEGERQAFDLAIDLDTRLGPPASAFQLAVWHRLRAVPYGTTTSYGQLAAALGRPSASRAVASAVARNPVSIVIPCHRVIGAGGALTGYAGGVERKAWLLSLEARGARAGEA